MASSPSTSGPSSSTTSSAPYYYGELKVGRRPPQPLPSHISPPPSQSSTNGYHQPIIPANGSSSTSSDRFNSPPASHPQQQFTCATTSTFVSGPSSSTTDHTGNTQNHHFHQHSHSLTDDSPSSSSVSSSRPSSSRESGVTPAIFFPHSSAHHVPPPAAFANPLLGIDADTRSSESLTRPSFSRNNSSNHNKNQRNINEQNKGNASPRQGLYQRSLNLLANGVSPLLKKRTPPVGSGASVIHSRDNSLGTDITTAEDDEGGPAFTCSPVGNKGVEGEQEGGDDGSGQLKNRRKSEPIMFSLDSITNEINRLQQRQEQMLENMNLDFENMLLSDEEAYCATKKAQRAGTLPPGVHPATVGVSADPNNPYGQRGPPLPLTAGHVIRQQHPQPQHHPQQLFNKEPFYGLMYGDDNYGSRPEENIYEEVDLMTLSSLRAQYADTLSLQSWKKKGGSKRALSHAASNSFSRWFSTRKKSPLVGDEESAYMDVKMSKKQRPPISLPDIPPEGLSQEQLKRRYILSSIVESENSYISSLHRLINEYKKPLEDSAPTVLSQNKINVIFYRLEQILQCHAIFGIALNQCVREWDQKERIGDVFIASFSKAMVLDIYSDFINNFTNAMETARKASKSKSAFAQFLQEKSLSSPDRLSFFGLMVKPVQRFPQFILLLNDLLKHTPSDHPDRMSLQLALTQLEALADRLNERKRDAERHFAVKQLLKDYLSSASSSSNRYLLRMDEVFLLDLDASTGLVVKTKCRKLYLLNDMLVCVSLPSERLKFAVALQDIDVVDDVTPASSNLVANSVLRSKDARTGSVSPQNCTVERMYSDMNNLIHDLEILSRVTNLVSSLRYQYNGLTLESVEQISSQIRNEIRRKDAQITLIDRSCFQLRIRSKNHKELVCVQMSDPEAKRDWLTDVRLAKLALDRGNNPAWDTVGSDGSLSASSGNIHSLTQQRVPLFVKSLPIFATSDTSQLTCALFYQLPSSIPGSDHVSNVLWICNVNESGSQLGALSTNGADVSLIHSYELCDSQVTCLESVGSFSVWIGLKQGRVIVIDATSPDQWRQLASLEVAGEVVCMKHFGKHVYVGLKTGLVAIFDVIQYEEPAVVTLSNQPVTCMIPVGEEMFATSANKIWVLKGPSIERSYSLSENEESGGPRPHLLAHCGIGLWVSLEESSIIRLYHTETFKHLQDLNIASNVKRILSEATDYHVVITSMLATRGLLWVGTNVGVIVTLTLPRLQGVPLASSGSLNVALHRHLGPVTILLSLNTPPPDNSPYPASRSTPNDLRRNIQKENEDIESIYGLYSDLMKVGGEFAPTRRPPHQPVAMTRMGWDLTSMAMSEEALAVPLPASASNGGLYQDSVQTHPMGHQMIVNRNPRVQNSGPETSQTLSSDGSVQHTSPIEVKNGPEDGMAAPSRASGNGYGEVRSASASAGTGPYGELGGRPQSRRSATGSQGPVIVRRDAVYSDSPINSSLNGQKTALLITGGNGYKRGTHDNPFPSQHAHCIIWEYKL